MVDREATTMVPPPPAESDLDRVHRDLVKRLADHEDPKVRILAHISTRQFELSERLSAVQQDIRAGFQELKEALAQTRSDLGDKIDKLDNGFVDIEERTEELERRSLNGSSSPAPHQQ